MQENWLKICGVPTKVLTWGQSLDDKKFQRKELVLCITGNPGLSGFYTIFLSALYRFLLDIPVWCISHAGHEEPDNESMHIPPIKGNKSLYNLEGQIKHKAEFIRHYIPSDVKIHIIGHSIGSYITLELLKSDDINKRIKHCYFLFPTIEHMADSPNGKMFIAFIQSNYKLVYCIAALLAYIPTKLIAIIVSLVMWCRSIPQAHLSPVLMHFRPTVLSKIIFMANDEMMRVQTPNYQIIEKNKKRLTFIYSLTDKWTPITYYERLVARFPDIDAQVTDEFRHAFVINTSYEMAAFISARILDKTEKTT